ncbi:hypothetical protein [Mycobacterium sp. E796]|uniref:hypothetical protein n=1 Tax=Mycobacterium sp. E796 TaxID=1834151 RepID=UPI0007FF467F|nr:hypothetical protein [Mycobacterium sp. E796]OBI53833.1 hypothetical protein A5706_22095 [Mycobacterium sp. E796]
MLISMQSVRYAAAGAVGAGALTGAMWLAAVPAAQAAPAPAPTHGFVGAGPHDVIPTDNGPGDPGGRGGDHDGPGQGGWGRGGGDHDGPGQRGWGPGGEQRGDWDRDHRGDWDRDHRGDRGPGDWDRDGHGPGNWDHGAPGPGDWDRGGWR